MQTTSMQFTVTFATAESWAWANVSELHEEGGTTSTITATVLTSPHWVNVPLVYGCGTTLLKHKKAAS